MSRKFGPKIKEIVITPIATVDPPLLNAAGIHAPYALRTILEIITDDDIVGISEIPGNRETDLALKEACEVLIGQDVFEFYYNIQKLSDALTELRILSNGSKVY